MKDLAVNEHSKRRLAPPTGSDTAREIPELMSELGSNADDGGYHYYERAPNVQELGRSRHTAAR